MTSVYLVNSRIVLLAVAFVESVVTVLLAVAVGRQREASGLVAGEIAGVAGCRWRWARMSVLAASLVAAVRALGDSVADVRQSDARAVDETLELILLTAVTI